MAEPPPLAALAVVVLAAGCMGTQTPKLSEADAQKAALTRAPGGTVKEGELEK